MLGLFKSRNNAMYTYNTQLLSYVVSSLILRYRAEATTESYALTAFLSTLQEISFHLCARVTCPDSAHLGVGSLGVMLPHRTSLLLGERDCSRRGWSSTNATTRGHGSFRQAHLDLKETPQNGDQGPSVLPPNFKAYCR